MKTDTEAGAAVPAPPASFAPAAIYSDGQYMLDNRSWHAEDSDWKAQQIQRMLDRNRITPASICEVGCGAGGILRRLSKAYPQARFVGYERSPQAMALCRAAEPSSVSYRMEDVFASKEEFDCLLCIDVFEHVEDYMGFLSRLRGRARYKVFHIPLDISILSILNSSMMRARRTVGHLHYFNRDTALATLADCGYRVLDGFFTTPFAGLKAPSLQARLAKLPRRALFALHPGLSASLLGGCSYLVLAE